MEPQRDVLEPFPRYDELGHLGDARERIFYDETGNLAVIALVDGQIHSHRSACN